MTHTNEILNELVSATRDGQSFYELAATEVSNFELQALFTRIAKVKGDIVAGLSTEIRANGAKPTDDGTWSASVTRNYVEVRALLGDKNYTYVAQLENSEDQLLEAFDKALKDTATTPHAQSVITSYLPEVRSCHAIMRAKKSELKAAA